MFEQPAGLIGVSIGQLCPWMPRSSGGPAALATCARVVAGRSWPEMLRVYTSTIVAIVHQKRRKLLELQAVRHGVRDPVRFEYLALAAAERADNPVTVAVDVS